VRALDGPAGALAYIASGQTPFFRLPLAVHEPGTGRRYAGAAAVLLGVPWDGGATVQAGARLAPYHVRRVSAFGQPYHLAHRIDVFAGLRAVDGGNLPTPPFDAALAREIIRAGVAEVVAEGAMPFLVGGDHSISLPSLRAVAAAYGPVAVVHVDAHLDTSDGSLWGDDHHHGTPLRHALLEGLIRPGGLHQIGVRASAGSAAEASFSSERGARVYEIEEMAARGARAIAAEIRAAIGDAPTYLTFDVDAVDPAHAPGTGTPVPGGLSAREAIGLLRGLAGVRLVGMDVVEVLPALDHADLTTHLAAQLLFEGLALGALARAAACREETTTRPAPRGGAASAVHPE
jgi:agmatinase